MIRNAKDRYNELSTVRQPYLDRAEKYSEVTLRYIMPKNRQDSETIYEEFMTDFSSVGADAVNFLSNVYMLTMFPPNRSFFRLQPSDSVKPADYALTEAKLETLLAGAEREARLMLEKKYGRPALQDLFKHLIVTGNALLYYPAKSNIQMYALDQYVVSRSMDGSVTETITKDFKSLASLPRELMKRVMSSLDYADDIDKHKTNVALYTHIQNDPDNDDDLIVYQDVESVNVTEPWKLKRAKTRWVPQVWNITRREPYGRGLVEDHYGDLYSLSVLEEAMTTGAASMLDIKHLVDPGSQLDIARMNSAPAGTYHYGGKDDVSTIDKGDGKILGEVSQIIERKERAVGKAFLSISTQIRDAERVTAEENRMRAQELEKAHGGVFSTLALNLQKPLATLLLDDLDVSIEGSGINPIIVSGLDAMGRVSDNEKLLQLFNDLGVMSNLPDAVLSRFKFSELMVFLANGRDIDIRKITLTDEEFQKMQQAAQQQQVDAQAQEELINKAEPEQIAQGMQG